MPDERFAEHLCHPVNRGHLPDRGHHGSAGGTACGDLARIGVVIDGDTVADAGFEASGCGATTAACSAAVSLVFGEKLIDAARVGTHTIAAELGGLSAGKIHAAELAADALHRALGLAAAADAASAPIRDRTLVAMSGGVDSAVAALLIQKGGPDRTAGSLRYGRAPTPREGEVVAVTLELWRDAENDGESSCCSASAVRTARSVAHQMGIAHFTLDLRDEFRAGVVEPWLAGHAAGETPNPCIRCNGNVRLDAMIEFGERIGATTLATGHYARVGDDGLLRTAVDESKDQSYMLSALVPESLSKLRFPLGELRKSEVRAIARERSIPVAEKPDSQDLCFLAGTGRERFLARHGGVRDRMGEIVDSGGSVVGRHRGTHGFTVGQRRGLNIGGTPEPLYVLETDVDSNRVTVGTRAELATTRVELRDVTLHLPETEIDAVKLRYRHPAVACTLNTNVLELSEAFEGVAPGQTAVLLRGDSVAGSATIAR